MTALVFLFVLLAAKALSLAGHTMPVTLISVVALTWQDVLVAGIFAFLFAILRRRTWAKWLLFGVAVGYTALNLAVIRVLSSPLTLQMLRAARGALSDSIAHYLRFDVLAPVIGLVTGGALLAFALRNVTLARKAWVGISCVGLAWVVAGPYATSKVDTRGMERNSIVALVSSTLPRIRAAESTEYRRNWRQSPIGLERDVEDLSSLRGIARNKNIILVMLESAGAEYLRTYGSQQNPMPFLDALSKNAIVFENAYAVYPESIKTLYSVLASQYPAVDVPPDTLARSQQSNSWLAASLKQAGYASGLFHSGRFMYLGMDSIVSHSGFDVIEDAGAIGGNRESSFGVQENATIKRILGWVESLNPGQRFFLTYLPIAGHHPYDTPQPGPFPEAEERDRYLNALFYADSSLKALIQGLEQNGRLMDSVLIIAGDHGEAFGKHEGNFGHSLFINDENVRVPLMIVAPGKIEKEIRVNRPVSLIDIAPTVLELEGTQLPTTYQGSSMLGGREQMVLFYTDYSLTWLGLRDGCLKYVHEVGSGRDRLYDLCEDPDERQDISSHLSGRLRSYRDHVMNWSREQKAMRGAVSPQEKALTAAQMVIN